jgi:hypothetical protein
VTGEDRPALRAVGGGREDPVIRRRRFEAAHPEAVILPPAAGRCRAVVPAGMPSARGRRVQAVPGASEDRRGSTARRPASPARLRPDQVSAPPPQDRQQVTIAHRAGADGLHGRRRSAVVVQLELVRVLYASHVGALECSLPCGNTSLIVVG